MVFTPELNDLIQRTPDLLLRRDIYRCAHDPKFPGKESILYIPAADYDSAMARQSGDVRIECYKDADDFVRLAQISGPQGLLYVPFPYLVPGGRFNEMYGWDTAFAVFAWAQEHPRMMREQIDNHLYQIRAYGKVLNANRMYYIGRSHPPMTSVMIMALIAAVADRPWSDVDPDGLYRDRDDWLLRAYADLCIYHRYWTSGERLAGETGLSRYWDEFDLPAPEVLSGEFGHYNHAIHHFTENPGQEHFFSAEKTLTPLYYRADRTMRASGFDPTGHWGYGGLRCLFHAPVCLNSLLFRMENDLGTIAQMLDMPYEKKSWQLAASERKRRMFMFLWDAQTGTFQDYDLEREAKNDKPFGTSFYPLWAGIFDADTDREKITSTVTYSLQHLEQPFGLCVSTEASGSQWDYPYGWAPHHYIAVAGLMRYGFTGEAERIAGKFCNLVQGVFHSEGKIFEKYNVVAGNADIHVVHGYDVNVSESCTFLWTAAVAHVLSGILARAAGRAA